MITTLSILTSAGDNTLTWDHADPAACAQMRETVADLRAKGYQFFLTDGSPADEVTAGGGTLIVRKITADELLESAAPMPDAETSAESEPVGKRKGGRKKGTPNTSNARNVTALRPMAGG